MTNLEDLQVPKGKENDGDFMKMYKYYTQGNYDGGE